MGERGSRTDRVFARLRARILDGEWAEGERLPSHLELADAFGVAPLTMRQVLARLEGHGLVQRRRGSGTFVHRQGVPAALIVDDEPDIGRLLAEYVQASGYRAIVAASGKEGLAQLETDPSIQLVFSDLRMPTSDEGLAFIRAVRRRWPALALAAVTAFTEDLAPLRATPEWPVLVIPKPFRAEQIGDVVRLALASGRTAVS